MSYPLVRDLAASGIPVTVTCRVLKIARQPYYRWLANPITYAELEQAYRANALFDAHCDDPEFGYRFLADEAREAGVAMAGRTAWRLCSQNQWWSAFGKKSGKNGKKPGPPVHDDLCAVTDENGRVRHAGDFGDPAALRPQRATCLAWRMGSMDCGWSRGAATSNAQLSRQFVGSWWSLAKTVCAH